MPVVDQVPSAQTETVRLSVRRRPVDEASETTDTEPACERQPEIDDAIADVEAIVAGNLAWFSVPHPLDGTDENGNPHAPHWCPIGYGSDPLVPFTTGTTPALFVNCNDYSPDGLCIPEAFDPWVPGTYSPTLWTDNPMWTAIGFSKLTPHAFHYELSVRNEPDAYGRCSFTASAWADFDDDAVFSTYERQGSVDIDGPVLEPLFIDNPCE